MFAVVTNKNKCFRADTMRSPFCIKSLHKQKKSFIIPTHQKDGGTFFNVTSVGYNQYDLFGAKLNKIAFNCKAKNILFSHKPLILISA